MIVQRFIGLCGALLFGVGLLGAAVLSIIVDRFRKYEEAAKISYAICACLLVAFMLVSDLDLFGAVFSCI